MMRVGVPKEIKVQEYRVGLTPGTAHEYVAAGLRGQYGFGSFSLRGASALEHCVWRDGSSLRIR